jgi:hypothetical protein
MISPTEYSAATSSAGTSAPPTAGAWRWMPAGSIEIVRLTTPSRSRTSGPIAPEMNSAPIDRAEPSTDSRGVTTIASASTAATPGATRIGENIRATVAIITTLPRMTSPGRGGEP